MNKIGKNFVFKVAHMQIAIGVRGTVMSYPLFELRTTPRFLLPSIEFYP